MDIQKEYAGLLEAFNSVYTKPEQELLSEETLEEKKIATGTGKKVMPSAKERSALAKKARAGKDIGKKGKGFKAVAAKAAKQYGSKEAGERVAAAAMFKQQAAEEVESWVNQLIEEGYDLSEYTWDDMFEMYMNLDEDAKYDRNRRRAAQRAEARNEARRRGQTGSVPGVGYVSPRPERSTYTDSAGVVRHHTGARMPKKEDQNESYDLFDIILEHLVAEGYADTNEAALAIMANMSEEWKQSIVEADSMAAFQARREARLARQRKREGRPSGGGDFGHDYGKPRAQADAEREQRMKDFINKKN